MWDLLSNKTIGQFAIINKCKKQKAEACLLQAGKKAENKKH
jgi:hypothetical protein